MAPSENAVLPTLFSSERSFAAGDEILSPHERGDSVFRVRNGWLIQYILLDDGRRQVVRILLPGDSFGIIGALRAEVPYTVSAITDAVVGSVSADALFALFRGRPEVATSLVQRMADELMTLLAQQVAIGRMNARERMARLLFDLHSRLAALGEADGHRYRMPLTQDVMADALGISAVHVSRTLSSLRAEGLLEWTRGSVRLLSPERLGEIAQIDNLAA